MATELARRMLTRLPLSKAQTTVLKTLMDAHPEWVSRDELSAATGYSSHQLAGVMGAFGRRASKTDGYRPGIRLFDTQWNDETGAWDYRLPDTMLEGIALGEAGLTSERPRTRPVGGSVADGPPDSSRS